MYPLCSSPAGRYSCCSSTVPHPAFSHYGVGTAHYFMYVKALTWLMLAMFLVTLPQL